MIHFPTELRIYTEDSEPATMPTVRSVCIEFLTQHSAAQSTIKTYASRLMSETGFATAFGACLLNELDPSEVDRYSKSLNLSHEGRKSWISAAKMVTKFATEREYCDHDPLIKLKRPSGSTNRESITTEEWFRINKFSNPNLRRLLWFCWLTGCRPGEARILRWSDVTDSIATPEHHKTERFGTIRKIYLSGHAVKLIAFCQKTKMPAQRHIFVNFAGKPWTKDALCQAFRRVRQRAGIAAQKVLYCARHSFLTEAARVNPMPIVQKLAGHSRLATTERYLHFDDDTELTDAANKVR